MTIRIEKYHRRIQGFVNDLCQTYYQHSQREDRADITNEVTLIAHQKYETVKDKNESEFLAWLYTVTRNVIRNWSRREGTVAKRTAGSLDDTETELNFGDEIQSDAALPEATLLTTERNQMIHTAISELPLIHQQVVWLFYIEELPEKQIAKRLGISKGTVKSRLYHARQRLTQQLASYMLE